MYNIYIYNRYYFSFQGLASKESVITPFRAFHDVVVIFAPEKTIVETCMATSRKGESSSSASVHCDNPHQGFQTSEDGATTLASHALFELGKDSA